jgi:hypothetical protein
LPPRHLEKHKLPDEIKLKKALIKEKRMLKMAEREVIEEEEYLKEMEI